MTDLLHTIPDFPLKSYTHLLPSLEKHLITTTDLLTLDALEIAKRARLPLLDVRRLTAHVIAILRGQLGVTQGGGDHDGTAGSLKKSGNEIVGQWSTVSTLDERLDEALGGGVPTGRITEITGESGSGKTQLLLTLLLSSQLPPPHGLARPAIYISTEHPLPTTRLTQLIKTHPLLSNHSSPPSLSQILTLQTPDLESQDHILTFQLPVALERYKTGLCIIDSIAANYRAEAHSSNTALSLAHRSAQLVRLGALLRSLARIHDCAIVVANQVADRFPSTYGLNSPIHSLSPPSQPGPAGISPEPAVLSLEHQLRFFTGWGADPTSGSQNLKTPSLGLVWANQIACRVALIKELEYSAHPVTGDAREGEESAEWSAKRWRRWMRVVFAGWVRATSEEEKGVEFELWAGGIRALKVAGSDGVDRKGVDEETKVSEPRDPPRES
ncbi:hypothetical protein MMC07_001627 [Pseudocyphellaria aurata]|nr:hypothetical protein [Pseudocyphellaria aurata]